MGSDDWLERRVSEYLERIHAPKNTSAALVCRIINKCKETLRDGFADLHGRACVLRIGNRYFMAMRWRYSDELWPELRSSDTCFKVRKIDADTPRRLLDDGWIEVSDVWTTAAHETFG